jgi:hypothetical protein
MKDNVNKRIDEGWQIDELFRQGLGNLQPEPSNDLWKGINRKLWWDEISHFTFTNLSKLLMIGGIAIVMTAITALMVVVVPEKSNPDDSSGSLLATQAAASNGLMISVSSVSNKNVSKADPSILPASSNQIEEQAAPASSSAHHISLATILAAEEPASPSLTHEVPGVSNSPEETVRQERTSDLLTTMHSLNYEDYQVTIQGNDASQFIPFPIHNLNGKSPIPSFFSADLKVMPEVTMNQTSSSNPAMSFSSGLGFNYHFGRFSVGTGIGLDYEATDAAYTINYISKDSVGYYTQVVSYAINQQNPSEITFVTQKVTVYDSISHIADDRTRNRYTYLQIPILAGFRLLETTRLGLTVYAGPMVSFLVGKKEAEPFINYPNARIIRIDNNIPFRVETNWQIWTGLRLDYKISKEFSFFAEPYYKYYFKPMVEGKEVPSANPWSVGLGVGLQYNFGRKITAQ